MIKLVDGASKRESRGPKIRAVAQELETRLSRCDRSIDTSLLSFYLLVFLNFRTKISIRSYISLCTHYMNFYLFITCIFLIN